MSRCTTRRTFTLSTEPATLRFEADARYWLGVAAAGNTDVVRAKMRTIDMLNLKDGIEDILITLNNQYHLIRPLTGRSGKGLFLYLALHRSRANLAMARHRLGKVEEELDV